MKTLRLGILLFAFGFFSSILLGYVYSVTRKIIAERQKADLLKQQKEIFLGATNFLELKINPEIPTAVAQLYQAVDEKNKLIGYVGKIVSSGYGGEVLVLAGITPDGYVEKVRILHENETPGLGKGITREAFLGQFSGKIWTEVSLRKDNPKGKIDSLAGASRSSRAVTRAVQELGSYLEKAGLILRAGNVSN